jgi:(2Fe-2S) ferredoxin
MRIAPTAPRLHLFVCATRRADSPLGPGCAEAGDAVFDSLKESVSARRRFADIWITKTHCLGLCPRDGATVASYPDGSIFTEVHATEARDLLARELAKAERHEDTEL